MGDVSLTTAAYAKLILHTAKYPYCAVTGVLVADATNIKDVQKNQDLDIIDSIPLFHHSHYLSPMAEIALTQIDIITQTKGRIIAGYYAACENYRDNTVEKCPGLKIAEKIVENFPPAVFIVVDNKKLSKHLDSPAIKLHKYVEGKWKQMDENKVIFKHSKVLNTVSYLLEENVESDLVDFDNYLDDLSQDYTNNDIEKLIKTME